MTPAPTAATRLFALLGDPVSHSLSPVFQNAALRALGLDGVYVALRCSADDVPGLVRGLARAGGGGNVTVPHKEAAARAVERRTEAVEATGACNAFWLEHGRVVGDNTDVDGVSAAIRSLVGFPSTGMRVLLLGAGGAAAAVVYALVREGAERVVIVNRTRSRADELAHRFDIRATHVESSSSVDDLRSESFDLAVNATSLGLHADDPLPLVADGGPRITAALDLVYRRDGETPWVRAMRQSGLLAADGREMLLQQGAAAFRRWWRTEPPLDVMRAALERP